MEACQSTNLHIFRAGSEGAGWLRPNNGVGAARLRDLIDAGQARITGQRGCDANLR